MYYKDSVCHSVYYSMNLIPNPPPVLTTTISTFYIFSVKRSLPLCGRQMSLATLQTLKAPWAHSENPITIFYWINIVYGHKPASLRRCIQKINNGNNVQLNTGNFEHLHNSVCRNHTWPTAFLPQHWILTNGTECFPMWKSPSKGQGFGKAAEHLKKTDDYIFSGKGNKSTWSSL